MSGFLNKVFAAMLGDDSKLSAAEKDAVWNSLKPNSPSDAIKLKAEREAIEQRVKFKIDAVKNGEAINKILEVAGLSNDAIAQSPQYTIDTIIAKLKAVSALEPLNAELDAIVNSFESLNEKYNTLLNDYTELESKYLTNTKLMDQCKDELQEYVDDHSFS